MSEDTPGASALLPSGDLPPEERSVSVQKAWTRLDEIRKSPGTQEALARGDRELSEEIKSLTALTRTPTGIRVNELPDRTPEARQSIADTWSEFADLPAEVLQQVRERRPVSLDEYKLALAEKKRLFADKEWVRKYFDGDRAARTRMALISIITTSEVREAS
jgi:MoxR-like ATPase